MYTIRVLKASEWMFVGVRAADLGRGGRAAL